MERHEKYRWRKATDVNRDYALFELVCDGTVILDVGYSDAGVFEVAFSEGANGKVFVWIELQSLVAAGQKLADLDR